MFDTETQGSEPLLIPVGGRAELISEDINSILVEEQVALSQTR